MPISCKCILDRMLYKGAMTPKEYDKILRNIKTDWIPVTERLPEERGEYLITTTDGQVDKCFFIGKGERYFFGMHEYVTAWMPLPKPYEKGEE